MGLLERCPVVRGASSPKLQCLQLGKQGWLGAPVAARGVWREYEGNVWKEQCLFLWKICLCSVLLIEVLWIFFFNILFPSSEKSELLKTNKNISLKMFLSLLMVTGIFFAVII